MTAHRSADWRLGRHLDSLNRYHSKTALAYLLDGPWYLTGRGTHERLIIAAAFVPGATEHYGLFGQYCTYWYHGMMLE
jgi:hypothetical protein